MKTIITYCDNEPAHPEEQVQAAEVTVAFNGATPKAVDLCEVCAKTLVEPLRALLADVGQPTQQPAKAPAKRQRRDSAPADAWCPAPRCGWSGTGGALSQHATAVHGEIRAVLEGRHGRRGADGKRTKLLHRCDQCDAAYDSGASLGTHLSKGH